MTSGWALLGLVVVVGLAGGCDSSGSGTGGLALDRENMSGASAPPAMPGPTAAGVTPSARPASPPSSSVASPGGAPATAGPGEPGEPGASPASPPAAATPPEWGMLPPATAGTGGDDGTDSMLEPPAMNDDPPSMPAPEPSGQAPISLEPINVEVEGPHAYDTFTEGAKGAAYAEGLVYYPTDADGPFPVMILSPGLTASNTDYEVWGRVLASHGIVALLMQPTDVLDWNDARSEDLQNALTVVRGTLNDTGLLAGKLDTANVGFMGQSMGGGGTLIAGDAVGDDIQALIPMQPYAPGMRFSSISAPILIIAAERDTVAGVGSNAFPHYESIPDTTDKIYMEAAGADHYYSTDRNERDFGLNARYAIAFLKYHLEGDTRYEGYLYGAEHDEVASETSRYLTSR